MKRAFLISIFMGLASIVEAGQIVTYTSRSTVSQEEANNEALQGVAKQISSKVQSSETIIREQVEDNVSVYYYSINNISANVKLKGVTIVPLEKEGNFFKATASIDMDDLTADIRFQLKTLQDDISSSEKNIADYLGKRFYTPALDEIEKCKKLADQHGELLKQLSKIYPLNESLRLKSDLKNLEKQALEKVSSIKLTLNPDSTITVSDKNGPVEKFTVVFRQEKKTLLEMASDNKGIINFSQAGFSKSEPVMVEARLPLSIAKKAKINPVVIAAQKSEIGACKVQIGCRENQGLCSSLKAILDKDGLITDASDEAIQVYDFSYAASERGAVGAVVSYDCTFSLNNGNIHFETSTKCVGKDQQDAVLKGLKKANFKKFKQTVEKNCPQPEPDLTEDN